MTSPEYPLTIRELNLTCGACPSQWEGWAVTGEGLYVRYRWGVLRLDINASTVYQERLGAEFDGILDEGQMLYRLKEFITR